MVIQKRGLVVLFSFFSILLFSFFSQAANYEGLQLKKNNDEPTYKTYDASTGDGYGPKGWGWYTGNYCEGAPGGYDYDLPSFPPVITGCYVGAVDYEAGLDDECLYAYAKPGYIIYSHKYTKIDASGSVEFGGETEGDAVNFLNWGWLINPGGICGDDHYWHTCGPSEVDTFTDISLDSANPKVKTRFYCLRISEEYKYLWMKVGEFDKTVDQDEDGVPNSFDTCHPNDIKLHPSFPKDCVEVAEGKDPPKGKVKCTVTASLEVAGNDIDENCDGKKTTDADDDKDSCANGALNSGGVAYFWMPDAAKGSQCCGDDADDFGKVFTTSSGEVLCLENKKERVGTFEGGVKATVDKFITGDKPCNGDWCAPLMTSLPFHIFTIKKPGQSYDIVSNGEKWQACTTESKPNLDIPVGENALVANGFSCYKEGDRWSWVNCKPKASNEQTTQISNGIKDRVEGDGLFALPLKLPTENDEKKPIVEIKIGELYKSVYSDKSFDLIQQGDKQYLEAYIRFTNKPLVYPATVNLKIVGPKVEKENVIYFNQPILGYATNTPLLEPNRWIHVKIPLPTLYDVTSLEFKSSPEANIIEIRNVYLTYGDKPKICSGEASTEQSAWLDDLDWWEEGKKVTGEKLCNVLFDPNYVTDEKYKGTAWLGHSVAESKNRCCGNDAGEYYAGVSSAIGEKNYYGCWNSEPVKANNSVMDVEISASSNIKEKSFNYPVLNKEIIITYELICPENQKFSSKEYDCVINNEKNDDFPKLSQLISIDPTHQIFIPFGQVFNNIYTLLEKNKKMILRVIVPPENTYVISHSGEILSSSTIELTFSQLSQYSLFFPFSSFQSEYFKKIQITESSTPKPSTLTFSCLSSECTYPLPGEPPYTITNPHPELYELYFVERDEKGVLKETLISLKDQKFEPKSAANLRVKKLAQQVVFTSDGTNADFYGCNVVNYLISEDKVTDKNNKGYCNTAGGKYFCAPSVEKTIGVDKYTVIDSWSDQKLDRVGYDLAKDKTFDLKTYVPQLRQIPDTPILAVQRNHSSSVLATRNFIPNAEFTITSNKLSGWDIFKGNVVVPVESLSAKENKILTLKENEILRSGRIAIPSNSNLQFSVNAVKCTPKVLLNGITEVSPSKIDTGDARYLILEFTGPCTISTPFLQLIDDKGAIKDYNYQNPQEIARAGLGCCPDNSCWNGYACVEDMSPFSQFAEHITDGRDYRCIEGTWTSSPVKYSWNGDQWGFCPKDNQCFVRPSDPTNALVQSKFIIKDIYTKDNKATTNLPLCINDKESILDHYCDNGDWTSRTKFIASKLIDIAGDDHYTLYCAPPQQSFVEYDNQEKYIFGTTPVKEEPKPVELGKAKDTKPTQPSCFGFTPEISKTLGLTGLDKEDRCINNVCILKFQDSGTTKTAFATTLNKAATDPTSFMKALNLEPADIPTRCKTTDADKDKFVKCSLEGLDTKSELWYSSSFNAIMYSKDGITTSTSITDPILKFFKDLFSKTTTPEGKLPLKLLTDAKNVKDIYLLRQGEKQVTAITEIRGSNTTLIAEYKGFTTPICDYITNFISNDPDLKVQLLNKFTGQDKVRCYTTDDNIQRIEAIEGIDIFWPKLTGMLRVEEQE